MHRKMPVMSGQLECQEYSHQRVHKRLRPQTRRKATRLSCRRNFVSLIEEIHGASLPPGVGGTSLPRNGMTCPAMLDRSPKDSATLKSKSLNAARFMLQPATRW